MKKKYHLAGGQTTPSLSINTALIWLLACDYWNAPGWVYGILGTIYALIVISFFYRMSTEDAVKLPENRP